MTTRARRNRLPFLLLALSTLVLGVAVIAGHSALASPAATPRFLSSDQSLEVLRTAFGAVAERPIKEGRVAVAPTSAAISALSDQVNMANRAFNPRTGRMWAAGDTNRAWPLGIRGFTDVVTGDVYINAEFAMQTTTPHEMLHANVAPDFAETMGLSLYEGATEQLALDALRASNLPVPSRPEYPEERKLLAEVIRIAGPQLLTRAYLNGGPALAELVAAIGPETLVRVKGFAATGNFGSAMTALQANG